MKRFAFAVGALLTLNLSVALAEEEEKGPSKFAEETLTGDWNGLRTEAASKGFTWTGGLKVDSLHNRGGQSRGTKTVSHLDLKLAIDFEKAAGWQGGSALINVLQDAGHGPALRHTGNWMGVTNIEVGAPTTTRLFQAWIQQSLFDDKLAVLAGLYPIDTEFYAVDSAALFLGPQYGTPADLALTRTPSIFNNSAFGLRARWNFDKTLYAMGAILDGVPNDPRHPKHTRIRFEDGDGSFHIGEIGWLPEAENNEFKGHAKLALGLWNYTRKEPDLVNPADNRRQNGGYAFGERTLVRFNGDGERFLSGFARYTWSADDTMAVKNSLNLGIHVKGMVSERPDDIFGLAWTRAGLSSKWRQSEMLNNGNSTDHSESAFELTYRFALTPYLAIQPNAQYVRNPGGIAGTPNARLIGFRAELAL